MNMENEPKFYEWTIKIRVAANWVADGFDLDAERAHGLIYNHLNFAKGSEIQTEIVEAPSFVELMKEQGYPAAEIAEEANRRARIAHPDLFV